MQADVQTVTLLRRDHFSDIRLDHAPGDPTRRLILRDIMALLIAGRPDPGNRG